MSGGSNSLRLEHQGMCVGLLLSCVSTEGRICPRRGERNSYKLCLLCVQFTILLMEGGGVEHRASQMLHPTIEVGLFLALLLLAFLPSQCWSHFILQCTNKT